MNGDAFKTSAVYQLVTVCVGITETTLLIPWKKGFSFSLHFLDIACNLQAAGSCYQYAKTLLERQNEMFLGYFASLFISFELCFFLFFCWRQILMSVRSCPASVRVETVLIHLEVSSVTVQLDSTSTHRAASVKVREA